LAPNRISLQIEQDFLSETSHVYPLRTNEIARFAVVRRFMLLAPQNTVII
jgi:hypothetical protein